MTQTNARPPDATHAESATVLQASVLRVGLELGARTSVVLASADGRPVSIDGDVIPSVVGAPRRDVLPGLFPSGEHLLFGQDAVSMRVHVELTWPLSRLAIEDEAACAQLVAHVRRLIGAPPGTEAWAVVGVPVGASEEERARRRRLAKTSFERVLVADEPELAALGAAAELAASAPGVAGGQLAFDPCAASLIIHLGDDVTSLCPVRDGRADASAESLVAVAGDHIDGRLEELVTERFPGLTLTRGTVRQIKEKHAHIGDESRESMVRVFHGGLPRRLDFGPVVRAACEVLVNDVVAGAIRLLAALDEGDRARLARAIVLTGGGSRIDGLGAALERGLRAAGLGEARVRRATDARRLVARGALALAERVGEAGWSSGGGSD